MKFIIIERLYNGLVDYITIIFDKSIVHSYMNAFSIECLKVQNHPDCLFTCVSAGFYDSYSEKFFGESESLNISAHPNSEKAFNSAQYNNFYSVHNKLI